MRFSILGSHSTGKSTLLEALKNRVELQDFTFLGGITRDIKANGVHINEDGSDISQILVCSKHLQHFSYKHTILDRCAIDGVVYTAYLYKQKKVSKQVLRIAETIAQNLKYDMYFYLAPEFGVISDGVRSNNDKFQSDIANLFEDYFKILKIEPIRLTGSVERRVDDFLLCYQKYLKYKAEQEKSANEIINEIGNIVQSQIKILKKEE